MPIFKPRLTTFALAATLLPALAHGQDDRLDLYLASPQQRTALREAAAAAGTGTTDVIAIRNVLPQTNTGAFVAYIIATRPALVLRGVESLRLDKILANGAGSGGTSAVSSVIGPAVLGAAIEYGGILQESTGTATTLRFNALGLAKLAAGARQFPYCPAIDPGGCTSPTRALRRVSGSVSFEPKSTISADMAGAADPSATQLLGNDFQVTAWSVRVELTEAGRLDDPAYVARWTSLMRQFRGSAEAAELGAAIGQLFGGEDVSVYGRWRAQTLAALRQAPDAAAFRATLAARIDQLVDDLVAAHPDFPARVLAAARAYEAYRQARDTIVMDAMVHEASVEFTHRSPLGQPGLSNLRAIYAHTPMAAPLLLTANAAVTFYDSTPAVGGRLRDLQLAAQLDRPLRDVPGFGPAVFTLAAYYQYMKADAVLEPGVTALPGLVLADGSKTVLGTKGHIGVVQAKLSVPLGEVVKVPFSVTWSNRRELVPERSTFRGQVGLAIDLDAMVR